MTDKIEMQNRKIRILGTIMLFITSLIWGFTFVAQSEGMDYIGPLTFNAVRYFFGAISLIPIYFIIKFISVSGDIKKILTFDIKEKNGISSGIKVGIILIIAGTLQQAGIAHTSVAKAGFISVLYIVIIPILYTFIGIKSNLKVWISVALAIIGFYFLSINGDLSISKGDLLILMSSFCYAFHIIFVDKYAKNSNAIVFSIMQFITASIISGGFALMFENISLKSINNALPYLLFSGLASCGIAYTLQIIGQKYVKPTLAALVMSLESVFAVIGGYVFLSESITFKETLGCFLVFCAVILAQLPKFNTNYKKDSLYERI